MLHSLRLQLVHHMDKKSLVWPFNTLPVIKSAMLLQNRNLSVVSLWPLICFLHVLTINCNYLIDVSFPALFILFVCFSKKTICFLCLLHLHLSSIRTLVHSSQYSHAEGINRVSLSSLTLNAGPSSFWNSYVHENIILPKIISI